MPPLTTSPNPFLDRPASLVLVEAYLRASLPWTLPADEADTTTGVVASARGDDVSVQALIDAPPTRWSTRDVATPRGQFVGRLLEPPRFTIGADFGAVERVLFRLANPDGAFNGWLNGTIDVKGKTVDAFLYDWLTETVAPADPVFRGMILGATCGDSPRVVDVTCVPENAARAQQPVPRRLVTTANSPQAPALAPPTGGLGSAYPVGIGIGRNLPARLDHSQTSVAELELRLAQIAALLDADPDAATEQALLAEREAVRLRLANTSDLPLWFVTACLGTAAIHQLRVAGAPWIAGIDYTVSHRRLIDGRVSTRLRLVNGPYVGAAYAPITVDLERRFPDVKATTIATYQWADGFFDWTSRRDAKPVGGLTTRNLITGRSGFGLGAVRFAADGGGLEFPGPADWARQEFMVDLEFRKSPPTTTDNRDPNPGTEDLARADTGEVIEGGFWSANLATPANPHYVNIQGSTQEWESYPAALIPAQSGQPYRAITATWCVRLGSIQPPGTPTTGPGDTANHSVLLGRAQLRLVVNGEVQPNLTVTFENVANTGAIRFASASVLIPAGASITVEIRRQDASGGDYPGDVQPAAAANVYRVASFQWTLWLRPVAET